MVSRILGTKAFLLVFCIACNTTPKVTKPMLRSFKAPIIVDTLPLTTELKRCNSIHIGYYPIETVAPFGDTCKLSQNYYDIWDTSINRQVEQKADGLQVFIDTLHYVTIRYEMEEDIFLLSDTSQKYYQGYPCFIYNETSVIKWLHAQDGDVVVTQEALDSNYRWKPIQVWSWPWCGNSNYRAPIKPMHYLLFKVPLYKGDFYTDLRLKIYSRDAIYISSEYKAWVNYTQFDMPKKLIKKDGTLITNIGFIP
jgi:hypothetical protein